MTRTADLERPAVLLDRVIEYVVEHGLAGLSLRPLAKAVGCSPRILLYYFESKEALIVRIFSHLRTGQHGAIGTLGKQTYARPSDACRAAWKMMSAPQHLPLYDLFFETYAYALRHRAQYCDFLLHAVEDWLGFVAAPALAAGAPAPVARTYATIVLAGFRGFILDLCATRDRDRIDVAVNAWLDSLDSFLPKEARGAKSA